MKSGVCVRSGARPDVWGVMGLLGIYGHPTAGPYIVSTQGFDRLAEHARIRVWSELYCNMAAAEAGKHSFEGDPGAADAFMGEVCLAGCWRARAILVVPGGGCICRESA